jgi:putative methionine-R-sulfoxide reductase with GAF domain
MVLGGGAYINQIPLQQMERGRWVVHTHEVLNQLEKLSNDLGRAEALRPNEVQPLAHMQEAYRDMAERIRQTLATFQRTTQDNPLQQERIGRLFPLIDSQLGPEAAPDKDRSAAIMQLVDTMRDEEEQLLEGRLTSWDASARKTQQFFIGGAGALYLFLLVAYVFTFRDRRARERLLAIESETAIMHKTLAARMTEIVGIQQEIVYQRLNLQNAMQVITERTQQITHADGSVIEILDGAEMVYRAASGTMMAHIGLRIKVQGSLSGLCVSSVSTLRCDDSDTDARVDKDACRKVGIRSMIVVPLIQAQETVGVLKVASRRPNAFSEEDVSTLQLMAGILSATLSDAIASDELHASNQTLKNEKLQLELDKMELKTRADTDGMTGLKNHRYFQEYLLL